MKTKVTRIIFILAALVFFSNMFLALFTPHQGNAQGNGANIVPQATNIQCAATFDPTAIDNTAGDFANVAQAAGISGGAYQSDVYYLTHNGVWPGIRAPLPSDAQRTFNAALNGSEPALDIKFSGANGAHNWDSTCGQTLILFRTSAGTSNTLYGLWAFCNVQFSGNPCPQPPGATIVTATVTPGSQSTPATLGISLPATQVSSAQQVTMPLADPSQALGTYFGTNAASATGSGSAAAGQDFAGCLEQNVNNKSAMQSQCINSNLAGFVDTADISFHGDLYVAQKWAGPDIIYKLTSGPDQQKLTQLNIFPEFDLHTDQQQINFSDHSLDAFKALDHALNAEPNIINLQYNSNPPYGVSVTVPTGTRPLLTASDLGINAIATYYPASDSVNMVFTNGTGGNEAIYLGPYSAVQGSNGTKYGIPNWKYASNCGSINYPMFQFAGGAPKSAKPGVASASWVLVDDQCNDYSVPVSVRIAAADAKPPAPPDSSIPSTTNAPGIKCSVTFFNPLSWFLCPLAVTLQTLAASLDNQIASMLVIHADCPGNSTPASSTNTICTFKSTWSALRDVSLGLIVIAILIAIVAQALGFEMLDAYTLKKALPRVIAVSIGISLSWPLILLFINITNDLGTGIRELIYSTLKASGTDYSVALGGGGTFVGGLIGGVGIALLGWAGLLSFAATGALAAAVAFLILVVRQMLIALLVIFAPIALVCYVLPNTQKAWKLWWDSFSKALLMFPIIMAFLAIGHVFAAIASHDAGSVNQILAFVAYFAPYMLLPYTFRLAGGALATIGGSIHGGSKGLFGGLKSYRSNKVKQNVEAMKAGRRFNEGKEGSIRSRLNTGLQTAAHLNKAGLRRPSRMAASIRSSMADTNLEQGLHAAESLPGGKAFFASDDLMMAGLVGSGDYKKTMDFLTSSKANHGAGYSLDQAKLMADQAINMRNAMGGRGFDYAALAKIPATGTAFVGKDIGEWHKQIAARTQGNKSLQASIVSAGKSGFRSAQRYEASEAGFGDHMAAVAMAEAGANTEDITNMIVDKAYAGGGAAAVVGSRNDDAAKMFAQAAQRELKAAYGSGDEGRKMRALAQVANIQDQEGGAKRTVSDVIAQGILGFSPAGAGGKTVLQELSDNRDNPLLQQARRELGSEQQAKQLQQQQSGLILPGDTNFPTPGGPNLPGIR